MKKLFRALLMLLAAGHGMTTRADNYMYTPVPQVEWASTSDKCFVQTAPDKLEVFDVNGKILMTQTKVVFEAEFSPDGNQLAYIVPGAGIYSYSFANDRENLIGPLITPDSLVSGLHWLANGKQLAFWNHAGGISELHVINIDGSGRKIITKQSRPKFPNE